MDKLVNNFMHNRIIDYLAAFLSALTPSKINKFLIITASHIVLLKLYEIMHNI